MYDREMRVGETWAYREHAHTPGSPVIKAEIIQLDRNRPGKVRVRLHEGNPCDLWVPRVRLRVPWEESEAWLRDEQALEAARKASVGAQSTVEYQAADIVLAAYPRPDGILLDWPSGAATVCIPEPAAVAADLGLTDVRSLSSDPLAFIDRHGVYYASASAAGRLARLVAERYPERSLAMIAEEERQLRDEIIYGEPTDQRSPRAPAAQRAEHMAQRQLVFDLVREWCGPSAVERFDQLARLPAEVRRFKHLVIRAAQALEEAGRPEVAAELRDEAEADVRASRSLPGSGQANSPRIRHLV